jgi:hypothetical protein
MDFRNKNKSKKIKKNTAMKKLNLFLITLFVLVLGACQKEEDIKPSADPTVTSNPSTDQTVQLGETIAFNYNIVGAYRNCKVTQNGNLVSTSANGTLPLVINEKTVMVVSCQPISTTNDKIIQKVVTFYVEQPPPKVLPTVTLVADKTSLVVGETATLSWHASHADSIVASSIPNSEPKSFSGSGLDSIGMLTVTPRESTIYTITVWNKNGQASASVTVNVILPPPLPTRSDSLTFAWLEMDMLALRQNPTRWESIIVDCEKDNHWEFNSNARFHLHEGINWCGNYEIALDCSWELLSNNTQINIGGEVYTIEELTDTTLVVTVPMTEGSSTIYKYLLQKGATSIK